MNIIHAFLLGAIQGLTEFLPVSSSAHLILLPKFLQFNDPGLAFDVFLHLGTLLAVVYFFRKTIWSYVQFILGSIKSRSLDKTDSRFQELVLLFISFVVTGVIGFLIKDLAETRFRSVVVVGWSLLIFSFVMYFADKWGRKASSIHDMTILYAAFIGLFQAMAFIPGISRSGATIVAALLLGLNRSEATRYSFLLSIPVIAAAGLVEAPKVFVGNVVPAHLLIGFLSATFFGYIAIRLLTWVSKSKSFTPFVVYRIALAIAVLTLLV